MICLKHVPWILNKLYSIRTAISRFLFSSFFSEAMWTVGMVKNKMNFYKKITAHKIYFCKVFNFINFQFQSWNFFKPSLPYPWVSITKMISHQKKNAFFSHCQFVRFFPAHIQYKYHSSSVIKSKSNGKALEKFHSEKFSMDNERTFIKNDEIDLAMREWVN